jgi:hypothetical protein
MDKERERHIMEFLTVREFFKMREKECLIQISQENRLEERKRYEQRRMKRREKELIESGFTKNEHQTSYSLFKYGETYYVDFHTISEDSYDEWTYRIETIKRELEEDKKRQESDELYILGYNAAMKEVSVKERLKLANQWKKESIDWAIDNLGGFKTGENSAKKEIKQKILDLKNKYKGQYREETIPKLSKTINPQKEFVHKIRMEVLEELENKLKWKS